MEDTSTMDTVFASFLEAQRNEALAMADASDILDIRVFGPQHLLAGFSCKGLALDRDGSVVEVGRFEVGIFLHEGYLRRVHPGLLLTVYGPLNVWHPNVHGTAICIGAIDPGTSVVDLLHRVFEVLSYQNLGTREDDALRPEACAWARNNTHRFPVDARPLKRRVLDLQASAPAGGVDATEAS
jgi:hypothetical protein